MTAGNEGKKSSSLSEGPNHMAEPILPGDLHSREILRKRAEELADPGPGDSGEISVTINCLRFRIGSEIYAIELDKVMGVHTLTELTRIPCCPDFIKGVFRVSGKIVSVMDLRDFFGVPKAGVSDLSKVIVLANDSMEVGVLADAALGASDMALDELQTPRPALTPIDPYFLRGVTRLREIVINGDKLLKHERLPVDEKTRE